MNNAAEKEESAPQDEEMETRDDGQSDEATLLPEEKQQSSLDEQSTKSPALAASVSASPPTPAVPSSRQLSDTLISLVYLAFKLHDDPGSLSDSQLEHLYSLASSCIAHFTTASSIAQLSAAFLPLTPATPYHLSLHCPLLLSILTSLFTLSRQPENDSLLVPLLPLLLLPVSVLPSKADSHVPLLTAGQHNDDG